MSTLVILDGDGDVLVLGDDAPKPHRASLPRVRLAEDGSVSVVSDVPLARLAARRRRKWPGWPDGNYRHDYHDPGTGRFAPVGYVTPTRLRALITGNDRLRNEVSKEIRDKLKNDPDALTAYAQALRRGDKDRARLLASKLRRQAIGDRPKLDGERPRESREDRNAWEAGSRVVATQLPTLATHADPPTERVPESDGIPDDINKRPRGPDPTVYDEWQPMFPYVEGDERQIRFHEDGGHDVMGQMPDGKSVNYVVDGKGRRTDLDDDGRPKGAPTVTTPEGEEVPDEALPDDLDAAAERLKEIRAEAKEAGKARLDELTELLGSFQFGALRWPPPKKRRVDPATGKVTYSRGGGAEWEWWDELSPNQQRYIQRNWMTPKGDTTGALPDQAVELIRASDLYTGPGADATDGEVMAYWANLAFEQQAANVLASGRASRGVDGERLDDLYQSDEGIVPSDFMGKIDRHGVSDELLRDIARKMRELDAEGDEEAYAVLRDADTKLDDEDKPWNMDFELWQSVASAAWDDYDSDPEFAEQMIPPGLLVSDDDSWEKVYQEIIDTAQAAGLLNKDRVDAPRDRDGTDTPEATPTPDVVPEPEPTPEPEAPPAPEPDAIPEATPDDVMQAAKAAGGDPIMARVADNRMRKHTGIEKGDILEVEYHSDDKATIRVPNSRGEVTAYKVQWSRFDGLPDAEPKPNPEAGPEPDVPEPDVDVPETDVVPERDGIVPRETVDNFIDHGFGTFLTVYEPETMSGTKVHIAADSPESTADATDRLWKLVNEEGLGLKVGSPAFHDVTKGDHPQRGKGVTVYLPERDKVDEHMAAIREAMDGYDPPMSEIDGDDVIDAERGIHSRYELRADAPDRDLSVDEYLRYYESADEQRARRDLESRRAPKPSPDQESMFDPDEPEPEPPPEAPATPGLAEALRDAGRLDEPEAPDEAPDLSEADTSIWEDDDDFDIMDILTSPPEAPEPEPERGPEKLSAPEAMKRLDPTVTSGVGAFRAREMWDRQRKGEYIPDEALADEVDNEVETRMSANSTLTSNYIGQIHDEGDITTRQLHRVAAKHDPDADLDESVIDKLEAGMDIEHRSGVGEVRYGDQRLREVGLSDDFTLDDLYAAHYDSTQAILAEAGFRPDDTVTFYRGISGEQFDEWNRAGRPNRIGSAPLASVAMDESTADNFGAGQEQGATLSIEVPVRDIVSLPKGMGPHDSEVVVRGTDRGLSVDQFKTTLYNGGRWQTAMPSDAISPTRHEPREYLGNRIDLEEALQSFTDYDETQRRAQDWMARIEDAGPLRENIAVRMKGDGLAAMLREDEPRLKSQFETGVSGGSYSPDTRSAEEARHWGVPEDIPAEQRPIYGMVGDDVGFDRSLQYGEYVLRLDPERADDRVTLTMGDSLAAGGQMRPITLEEMDGADWRSYAAAGTVYDADSGYIEAQIHGGVGLDDLNGTIEFRPAEFRRSILIPNGRDENGKAIWEERPSDNYIHLRSIAENAGERGLKLEVRRPSRWDDPEVEGYDPDDPEDWADWIQSDEGALEAQMLDMLQEFRDDYGVEIDDWAPEHVRKEQGRGANATPSFDPVPAAPSPEGLDLVDRNDRATLEGRPDGFSTDGLELWHGPLRPVSADEIREKFEGFNSPAEAKQRMAKARERQAVARDHMVIRMPSEAAWDMSQDDSRIKSQFETGMSEGNYDPDYRRAAELDVLGVAPDVDDSDRPIYGLVDDPEGHEHARQYGGVIFKLDPAVADRATMTHGDSLLLRREGASGTTDGSVGSAVRLGPDVSDDDILVASEFDRDPRFFQTSYAEVQVHGGATMNDVSGVAIDMDHDDLGPLHPLDALHGVLDANPDMVDRIGPVELRYDRQDGVELDVLHERAMGELPDTDVIGLLDDMGVELRPVWADEAGYTGRSPGERVGDMLLPNPNAPGAPEGWESSGPQAGSNPGGRYRITDTEALGNPLGISDGDEFYVKKPPSEDHTRNEVTANMLYEAAGIEVPEVRVGSDGATLASRIIPGDEDRVDLLDAINDDQQLEAIQDGFMVDAWLANWDVLGTAADNLVTVDGKPVRLDAGGALKYRARGGDKGDAFGDTVGEVDTLRDPSLNPIGARVFGAMSDEQLADSARHVAEVSPEQIDKIVADMGMEPELAEKLKARRQDILDRFLPEASPDPTPEPDAPDDDGWGDVDAELTARSLRAGQDRIDAGINDEEYDFGGYKVTADNAADFMPDPESEDYARYKAEVESALADARGEGTQREADLLTIAGVAELAEAEMHGVAGNHSEGGKAEQRAGKFFDDASIVEDVITAKANERHMDSVQSFVPAPKGAQQMPYTPEPAPDDRVASALAVERGMRQVSPERMDEMVRVADMAPENLRTRVPASAVEGIIAEGRLKSQFETGVSTAHYSPETRRNVENEMLGVPLDAPDTDRAVYGYVDDGISDRETIGYGSFALKVRPEVAGRTSITFGDSYGIDGRGAYLGDELDGRALVNAQGAQWQRHFDADGVVDEGYQYTEAQFHGGLSLDDLDSEFTFHPKGERYDGPSELPEDLEALDALLSTGRFDRVQVELPRFGRDMDPDPASTGDGVAYAAYRDAIQEVADKHPNVEVAFPRGSSRPGEYEPLTPRAGVPDADAGEAPRGVDHEPVKLTKFQKEEVQGLLDNVYDQWDMDNEAGLDPNDPDRLKPWGRLEGNNLVVTDRDDAIYDLEYRRDALPDMAAQDGKGYPSASIRSFDNLIASIRRLPEPREGAPDNTNALGPAKRRITPDDPEYAAMTKAMLPGPDNGVPERVQAHRDGKAWSPELEDDFKRAFEAEFPGEEYTELEAVSKRTRAATQMRRSYGGQISQTESTRNFHRTAAELFPDRNLDRSIVDSLGPDDAPDPRESEWRLNVDPTGTINTRRMMQESYDSTQRYLTNDLGLDPDDEIVFYRGISGSQYDDWVAAGRPPRVGSSSVVAVTSDNKFAVEYGAYEGGVTLEIPVRVRDILTVGNGWTLGSEFVVLGRDGGVNVSGIGSQTFQPLESFNESVEGGTKATFEAVQAL